MHTVLSNHNDELNVSHQRAASQNNSLLKADAYRAKQQGKTLHNHWLKAHITLTEPEYPGSRDPRVFDRVYSPISRKKDVSGKIGSADHHKSLSSEKNLLSPPTRDRPAGKSHRWGSLAPRHLELTERKEFQKAVPSVNQPQNETKPTNSTEAQDLSTKKTSGENFHKGNERPSSAVNYSRTLRDGGISHGFDQQAKTLDLGRQLNPATKSNESLSEKNSSGVELNKTNLNYGRPATAGNYARTLREGGLFHSFDQQAKISDLGSQTAQALKTNEPTSDKKASGENFYKTNASLVRSATTGNYARTLREELHSFDSQAKSNLNIYYDEFTKPYARRTDKARPSDAKASQDHQLTQGVEEKIIEKAPEVINNPLPDYQSPQQREQEPDHYQTLEKPNEIVENAATTYSPPTKDTEVHFEKQPEALVHFEKQPEALVHFGKQPEALVIRILIPRVQRAMLCSVTHAKQKILSEAAQAEQELLLKTNNDIVKHYEEQDRKRSELERIKREIGLGNKQVSEEHRAKLRELKEREQSEYRKHLKELERSEAGSLERQLEHKKKYHQELRDQIDEQQRIKSAQNLLEKGHEATSLVLKGDLRKYPSAGDLKQVLLDQMKEREEKKAHERYEKTVKAREELDQKRAFEDTMFDSLAERDRLKKEEYVKAIQNGVDSIKKSRELSNQNKLTLKRRSGRYSANPVVKGLKEREELQRSMTEHWDHQNQINKKKHDEMEAYRHFLKNQIDEIKSSISPEKRQVDESSFINSFGSRSVANESKIRYREELLKQMDEDKERKNRQRAQSAEPSTGLNLTNRHFNHRILTSNELNSEILAQISQNQESKAKNRENKLREEQEYLRQLDQEREQVALRRGEAEKLKQETLTKSNLEMIEQRLKIRSEERRIKELEREAILETEKLRREHEAERLSKSKLDQSSYRETLQNQVNRGRETRAQEKARDVEHRDRFVLESTQYYDQLGKERRHNHQSELERVAEKMKFETNDQKEKLQTKNEREPSPFTTASRYWNPHVETPTKLSHDLLDQIREKQKLTESLQSEKKTQKEELEKRLALEDEHRKRFEEAEHLKMQNIKDSWINDIDKRKQAKEQARSQKLAEGEALQKELQNARSLDLLGRQSHENIMKGVRDELNNQISAKKAEQLSNKLKDQQFEREILQRNNLESYQRTLEKERAKKTEYREDLLKQMQSSPERIQKIAEGNTGLFFDRGGNRNYIAGEQLKTELADQIAQKQNEREVNRRRELDEQHKNLQELSKASAEADKKRHEHENKR